LFDCKNYFFPFFAVFLTGFFAAFLAFLVAMFFKLINPDKRSTEALLEIFFPNNILGCFLKNAIVDNFYFQKIFSNFFFKKIIIIIFK